MRGGDGRGRVQMKHFEVNCVLESISLNSINNSFQHCSLCIIVSKCLAKVLFTEVVYEFLLWHVQYVELLQIFSVAV